MLRTAVFLSSFSLLAPSRTQNTHSLSLIYSSVPFRRRKNETGACESSVDQALFFYDVLTLFSFFFSAIFCALFDCYRVSTSFFYLPPSLVVPLSMTSFLCSGRFLRTCGVFCINLVFFFCFSLPIFLWLVNSSHATSVAQQASLQVSIFLQNTFKWLPSGSEGETVK